jgi:DNA polymerase-3 subunit delta'
MNWDVLGHEWAADMLRQHIARGEVRHAYLFCGPPGIGRRTLALRFAQALNCQQPPEPGLPCGECRACKQIERMQHPDLAIVQAETEGGMLKVDQVRELQHSLSLSPYEARYRVALMLRFQEANPSAQNALLKTLEEAPAHVILLLVADTPESLLPTITSRCEILRLRPMRVVRLTRTLQERLNLEEEDAQLLAHLSGGRLGYALKLYHTPELVEQRREWLQDLLHLLGSNRRERFAYAESVAKTRGDRAGAKDNLRALYQVWLSFWRDLLLVATGSTAPLVNLDFVDALDGLVGQVDADAARTCASDLELALERLDMNLNMQLLTECLLLDWPWVEGAG